MNILCIAQSELGKKRRVTHLIQVLLWNNATGNKILDAHPVHVKMEREHCSHDTITSYLDQLPRQSMILHFIFFNHKHKPLSSYAIWIDKREYLHISVKWI